MTTSFKRTAMAGFTLIELLIVVIILAIISAIAIPQFSSATSDAQQAALDANLATVRNSLEQYRAQHTGNVYPGVNDSATGDNCDDEVTGTAIGAGTLGAMENQLKYPSNAAGQTCLVGDPVNYRYGPYLRQGIPVEPINNVATVAFQANGQLPTPDTDGTGWAYVAQSGQFIMNNSTVLNGRAYSAR